MLLDNRPAGERVIDVEVTEGDVRAAKEILATNPGALNSTSCAVAMALNRAMGGRWAVCHITAVQMNQRGCVYSHDGFDIVLAFDRNQPITGRIRLTPIP